MSCGRISFLSRIKWLLCYSFSRTKRPYETGKCHDCLWCEYIQQCMEDYKCLVEPEITGDFYKMAKTELSSAYGTAVSAAYRGMTHAVMGEPVENTKSHDDTLCLYDHVDEFLDELEREGDFR